MQRIPKSKGFKSLKPKSEEVNIKDLEKAFNTGDSVTPKILLSKGLIRTIKNGVKVLGQGELKKKLNVKANAFSKVAEKAIIKAGGKAEVFKKESKKAKKEDSSTKKANQLDKKISNKKD